LLSVTFCDGLGQFTFGVGAVSDVEEVPVVDDRDRGRVEGDVVRVVGVAVELGQVLGEPPRAPVCAEGAEGGRVALAV
jgi:hypothetical protein